MYGYVSRQAWDPLHGFSGGKNVEAFPHRNSTFSKFSPCTLPQLSKHTFCILTPAPSPITIYVWPHLWLPIIRQPPSAHHATNHRASGRAGHTMGSAPAAMGTHPSHTTCGACGQPTLHWMAATAAEPANTNEPTPRPTTPRRMRLCPPCWRRFNLGPIIPPMVNHD